MRDHGAQEPAGLILARCAEILERVDEALGAERYEETAAMLTESQNRLSALNSVVSAAVDPSGRGAYADLAAERVRLQDLLNRTEEILDRCRRKRSEALETLRLLRSEQAFCDGDLPGNGGWTDRTC